MSKPLLSRTAEFPPREGILSRYFPLFIIQSYLWMSVVSFAFGPWVWPVANPVELYGFLTAVHVALLIGYALAARGPVPVGPNREIPAVAKLVLAGCIAHFLVYPPILVQRSAAGFGDITELIARSGEAYSSMNYGLTSVKSEEVSFFQNLRTVLAPVLGLVYPLALYYWRSLPMAVKSLSIISFGMHIWFYMSIGTNKGLGDIVAIVVAVMLLKLADTSHRRRTWRSISVGGMALVAASLFLAYFGQNLINRRGVSTAWEYVGSLDAGFNPAHPLVASLPEALVALIAAFTSYWNQGYYGLSLCMQQEFVWTYGVGHSWALLMLLVQYFGFDALLADTYAFRTEAATGYSGYTSWHSIYPWFASDLTFIGVIAFFGAVGWFMCRFWRQARRGDDPTAVLMFTQAWLLLVYAPCNNQIFLSRTSFVCTWGFIALYAWAHRRARLSSLDFRPSRQVSTGQSRATGLALAPTAHREARP